MIIQSYNLSYNPNKFFNNPPIQSTNFGLGVGWSFVDLDDPIAAQALLDFYGYPTSITDFLVFFAPLEVTIPELMTMFYQIKKFTITTSLPAKFSYDESGETTTNTRIVPFYGTEDYFPRIQNIYRYIGGIGGNPLHHAESPFGYSDNFINNTINFFIRPEIYIYNKKYYIHMSYLQNSVAGSPAEESYSVQISTDSHHSFPSQQGVGSLTILGKNIPLYALSVPEGESPPSCNVSIEPIEYWVL
jgi:hypothetical protein